VTKVNAIGIALGVDQPQNVAEENPSCAELGWVSKPRQKRASPRHAQRPSPLCRRRWFGMNKAISSCRRASD
jgi:hypothetical protein